MRLGRATLLLGASVVFVGALVLYLSHYPEIADQQSPRTDFDGQVVRRGAALAMIGNCNACHTTTGGAPYAGGVAMQTPFGIIYSTNITPDPQTGIGRWSEEAFLRAMREGVRRDGAHLYPAFPYDHFTRVATDDLRAVYAFVMTRQPVHAEPPANALMFPLSLRAVVAGWKLLFFKPGELRPDPVLSETLNRGAYLVEGLAHCGSCHTPRNMLGAERTDRYLGGGEAEGWHAPALNAASTAPAPWTEEQLSIYLRKGFVEPHGVAAGPMREVANNLANAPEQDVKAMAAYIAAIIGPPTAKRDGAQSSPTPSASRALVAAHGGADGAAIYAGACAGCHEATGQSFSARGIPLGDSKVISMPDARNLAHVILEGIEAPYASPAATMPGFADGLTDRQVAELMIYLRKTFSDKQTWEGLENTVRKVRAASPAS